MTFSRPLQSSGQPETPEHQPRELQVEKREDSPSPSALESRIGGLLWNGFSRRELAMLFGAIVALVVFLSLGMGWLRDFMMALGQSALSAMPQHSMNPRPPPPHEDLGFPWRSPLHFLPGVAVLVGFYVGNLVLASRTGGGSGARVLKSIALSIAAAAAAWVLFGKDAAILMLFAPSLPLADEIAPTGPLFLRFLCALATTLVVMFLVSILGSFLLHTEAGVAALVLWFPHIGIVCMWIGLLVPCVEGRGGPKSSRPATDGAAHRAAPGR